MQQIILASQSPRRKDILGSMGIEFIVAASDFDEQLDDSRDEADVAKELARGKALAVAEQHPDAIVIGADTIVVFDGKQVGKPADADEAFAMLKMLQGTTHHVVTGIAVISLARGYEDVRSDMTKVVFKSVSDEALHDYIATGDPYDKAGGYGLQSEGAFLLDRFEGNLETILGLPSELMADMLDRARNT